MFKDTTASGLLTTLGLHGIQIVTLIFGPGAFLLLGLIGLTQFLYLVPAMRIAKKRGHKHLYNGLLAGAGITIALNVIAVFLFRQTLVPVPNAAGS
jgi:hypothetical protein